MKHIKKWVYSAAGKISIVMIITSLILIALACSTIGSDFLSERGASNANNILIGLATNLLGIVVTVSFVQYFLDKQDEKEAKEREIQIIKRYDKYMQTLIRRYIMFYLSVTTRIKDRNAADAEHPFERVVHFSDLADMYLPSMYMSEGFLESSVELFYEAEKNVRDYMLRMLENIDFKYNPELESILLDFTSKSTDLDVRGQILGAMKTSMGKGQKVSEFVAAEIEKNADEWIEKFKNGELTGNLFLPYVLFYYNIQDQMRLIRQYAEHVKKL